jgi:hypothetical protein
VIKVNAAFIGVWDETGLYDPVICALGRLVYDYFRNLLLDKDLD